MKIDINDEVFDVKKAADFLCKSKRKIYDLIAKGRLKAAKSEKKGGSWEILKSSCLEYVYDNHQNCLVSGDCQIKSNKRFKSCQSNKEMVHGTVTLLPQRDKELEEALAHRTRSKRRSYMTT